MFEIRLTESFAKALRKLENTEIERIKEKLKDSQENPMLFFERLSGHELYKLRIGKFRVIASFSFREKTITCLSVGLRKNVYNRLERK